jgi:UDP-2,4-diacetamido-2,4,6-trideoxy-beta-L-altropyranose hydrolase
MGHVMRCRTLADALRVQGGEVQFISRAHPGNAIAGLRAEGFVVSELSPPISTDSAAPRERYAAWLGVSQAVDAQETIEALDSRPDWLIVDHYGIGGDWERALRPHVKRMTVIDDLANRPHYCDFLVNQNYARNMKRLYDDKLPRDTERLLGPEYALLRPEYVMQRENRRHATGEVKRIFVFFGGTDPDNLTGQALIALSDAAFSHIAVDVVVGTNNPHRASLKEQTANHPNITLYNPRPHLADLMVKADLAIGAGGTTTWERCCLGLPSLVVSIAENQRPACEALARSGVIEWIGHHDKVTAADLADALMALIHDSAHVGALASASRALVDGNGTQRVVSLLMAHHKAA